VLFKIFAIIAGAAILVTHRKNIRRIWLGEEKKILKFGKKNNESEIQ
jgi:glycerol-3-phosphate acyltransferase PlsY